MKLKLIVLQNLMIVVSVYPTNPFEMVEMIRRANSMNEATKPSVAIDDALKLFNKIEEKENL